ncbi:MAG: DUF1553 domain-containing protein [Verrucomicrobiales bacterium]
MSTVPNAGNDPARLAEVDPDNLLRHRASRADLKGRSPATPCSPFPAGLSQTSAGRGSGESERFRWTAGTSGRSGPVDGEGRRSLYTEVRRNFLPPFLLAFDTPIPFNAMGRRAAPNVPAQSGVAE